MLSPLYSPFMSGNIHYPGLPRSFPAPANIKHPKMIRPQIPEAFQKILVEFAPSSGYVWSRLTCLGYD